MREPDSDEQTHRRRRLLYRATHCGTHENDLLLGGFVAARLSEFSLSDLDALEVILAIPDPDLADYLTGRRPIPSEAALPLLTRIRDAALRGPGNPDHTPITDHEP